MKKRDWLLVAINERMEPIQIQKTLFKYAMESKAPASELYDFAPYNWGPLSIQIYDDLATLCENGDLKFVPSGQGWNIYEATESGKKRIRNLRKNANPKLLAKMDKMREYVTDREFGELLQDIYKDYPYYASKSLFRKE